MIEAIKYKEEVLSILDILNSNGYTGYIVGGAVRDYFMDCSAKDIDFATNMPYKLLKEKFHHFKLKLTGKAFGVLRVITENDEYEIAQYREDVNSKIRKPESIVLVENIEDDLSRRDFTMNAVAWNQNGFVDKFDGMKHIQEKKICFVGEARIRIQEDALRILRAIRFVAKLNFDIEESGIIAIKENKLLLKQISKERIYDEFKKIMQSSYYMKAIQIMEKTEVLFELFPILKKQINFDQKNKHHTYTLWEHTLKVVAGCQNSDYLTRIAALFHDVAKVETQTIDSNGQAHYYRHEVVGAEITSKILNEYKFTNDEKHHITKIILNHIVFHQSQSETCIRRMIARVGKEDTMRLAQLSIADNDSKQEKNIGNILIDKVQSVVDKYDVLTVNDLKLTGYDLMQLGFQSKMIGKIKKELLDEIIENGIENNREVLLNIVKKRCL